MSWSLAAIGKRPAVEVEITKQASGQKCSEPEETVRLAAVAVIKAALAAQDPTVAVKVSACGSQSVDYTTQAVRNQLSISIEPLYGFVE